MDARVEALIDELSSAGHLQPAATRERILALFDEVRDEPGRVALLHLFDAAMSITVRHMEAHGQNTTGSRMQSRPTNACLRSGRPSATAPTWIRRRSNM